jgi:hypothetical protein
MEELLAGIGMTLLLALHLLSVNVASGGPIITAWLDWRATRGSEVAAQAASYLARASLFGLLLGAALGLLVGWLKWDSTYQALWLGPLSYKMKWAIVEAVFSLILMVGWLAWLPRHGGGNKKAMWCRAVIAVLAATNLLYHFPMLFSVAAQLQEAGETTGPVLGGRAFRGLVHVDTIALEVHVALASVAVAGVVLVGLASRLLRHGEIENAAAVARWAGRWALIPSLVQLPVGLWMLSALPPQQQAALMGNSTIGIMLFAAAIGTALWLLNELAKLAMGEIGRLLLMRTVAAMLFTVTLMTGMQLQTRTIPSPSSAVEQSEVSP